MQTHSYRTVVTDAELVEGIMKDASANGELSLLEQDVIDTLFEDNGTAHTFMLGIHPDLTDESHQALDFSTQFRFGRTPWTQPANRLVTVSDEGSSDDEDTEPSNKSGAGSGKAKMPMLYYDSKQFSRTEF